MEKILKQQTQIVIIFAVIVLAAFVFLKNYYLGVLMAFFAIFSASFPFKLYLQKKKALAIASAVFLLLFFAGVFIFVNWKAITREYVASISVGYDKNSWRTKLNVPDDLTAGDYFLELKVRCGHGLESEFCRRDSQGVKLGISGPNYDLPQTLYFPVFLIERIAPAKLTAIFSIVKSLDIKKEINFVNGDYLFSLAPAKDIDLSQNNFSDHKFTIKIYKKRFN